jgi:AcrR family transcriptional regulator
MQSQIAPDADQPPATGKDRPSGNDLRVAKTKARIIAAVVQCLDEVGYSETSINRVQGLAGVSRGALTHHFPSKIEMMVETLERLLDPVRGQINPPTHAPDALGRAMAGPGGIADDLERLWYKVLNTVEGRALVEILVAARTDRELGARIGPSLTAYNRQINANIQGFYAAATGDDNDVAMLWTICRTFLRGLHLQARFEDNPEAIRALLQRFAQVMAPQMTARRNGTD